MVDQWFAVRTADGLLRPTPRLRFTTIAVSYLITTNHLLYRTRNADLMSVADTEGFQPFERLEQSETMDLSSALMCGGIHVMSGYIPCGEAETEKHPIVVFQFITADGQRLQPIVLASDELSDLVPLIVNAVDVALEQTDYHEH